MEYISKSEKETYKLAENIASSCLSGNVYALFGELGSGKTTFTKGFAKAMGVRQDITSPTFVVIKQYKVPEGKKSICFLFHVDCYRLVGPEDAESVGLDEILSREDSVTVIEWPERIENLLPRETIKINFEYIDENTRKITTS